MKAIGIIGRIPFLRDRVLFPAVRSDGRQDCLTAREALRIEERIKDANRAALQNPINRPNIFLELFGFIQNIFSRFNSGHSG